jgi:hypothetical protein
VEEERHDGCNDRAPTAAEHVPYYEQYIRLTPDGDIVEILAHQIATTCAYFGQLTPEQTVCRPTPGEWCAADIVGHLSDVERVFSYRALRLSRGDFASPEDVDFEAYAAVARYAARPMPDIVAGFAALRAATLALLRNLDEDAWARRAPESWSLRSVRAFAYLLTGHELHHLYDVQARLPAA